MYLYILAERPQLLSHPAVYCIWQPCLLTDDLIVVSHNSYFTSPATSYVSSLIKIHTYTCIYIYMYNTIVIFIFLNIYIYMVYMFIIYNDIYMYIYIYMSLIPMI